VKYNTVLDVSPVEISGPVTIIKPGYYQIVQDITPSELKKDRAGSCMCINIKSSDVLIDGMGHVVDGRLTESSCPYRFGFFLGDKVKNQLQYPNVIIKNVTAAHWSTGIFLSGAHEVRLERVTLSENTQVGLELVSSSGILLNQSSIINTKGQGIVTLDSENVAITHTTVAENSMNGINMMGITLKKYPIEIKILDYKIPLTELLVTEQKTSGNGYDISHNLIRNNNGAGISISNSQSDYIERNVIEGNRNEGLALTNIDSSFVRNNTVNSNGGAGISLRGCGQDLTLEDNTFSGNTKDNFTSSRKTNGLPPILFGTFLVILLNVLAGTLSLSVKGGTTWILKKISIKHPADTQKAVTPVHGNRFLRLFTGSTAVFIAGALILGGAFTYSTSSGLKPETFLVLTFIGGIVTVVPKVIQYSFARDIGMQAAHRMWWGGILIMCATTLLFKNVFGQPIRTEVLPGHTADQKKIAVTMLAGPVVSVLLSFVFFLLLFLIKGSFASLALVGVQMGLLSALLQLLPVPPMDGILVFRWNRIIWAALFFPVLLGYYEILLLEYVPFSHLNTANLLIGGIITGVIIGIGFGLWYMKNTLAKNP
jgi:parallel beta-helix repeat protein